MDMKACFTSISDGASELSVPVNGTHLFVPSRGKRGEKASYSPHSVIVNEVQDEDQVVLLSCCFWVYLPSTLTFTQMTARSKLSGCQHIVITNVDDTVVYLQMLHILSLAYLTDTTHAKGDQHHRRSCT